MNLRRALTWFRDRLVILSEAGALRVPWEGRMVQAEDADDLDEWLCGRIPPSLADFREQGPARLAAQGVEVG